MKLKYIKLFESYNDDAEKLENDLDYLSLVNHSNSPTYKFWVSIVEKTQPSNRVYEYKRACLYCNVNTAFSMDYINKLLSEFDSQSIYKSMDIMKKKQDHAGRILGITAIAVNGRLFVNSSFGDYGINNDLFLKTFNEHFKTDYFSIDRKTENCLFTALRLQ